MTPEIELTQGQVALVDHEDYERVAAHKWYAHWNRHNNSYYARSLICGRQVYMHSFIMGVKPGEMVDHWNHDTLDNRRANLRRCDAYANMGNGQKHSDGMGKYKGIMPGKNGRWKAEICVRRTRHYLGQYGTQEEAYAAYSKAALELRGYV